MAGHHSASNVLRHTRGPCWVQGGAKKPNAALAAAAEAAKAKAKASKKADKTRYNEMPTR